MQRIFKNSQSEFLYPSVSKFIHDHSPQHTFHKLKNRSAYALYSQTSMANSVWNEWSMMHLHAL